MKFPAKILIFISPLYISMRKIINLNGLWRFNFFDPGSCMGTSDVSYDDSGWFSCSVPGDVHVDLVNQGVLPDPYLHLNFRKHYWIEGRSGGIGEVFL